MGVAQIQAVAPMYQVPQGEHDSILTIVIKQVKLEVCFATLATLL